MSLEREVAELMRPWARKGGKKNRQVQVKRLLMFARDLDAIPGGPRTLGEVGRRQAIRWYRSLERAGRSPATVGAHAYALRALWSRLGRDPEDVIYRQSTEERRRGRRGGRGCHGGCRPQSRAVVGTDGIQSRLPLAPSFPAGVRAAIQRGLT